jgi:multiple sugar transport system permease protein
MHRIQLSNTSAARKANRPTLAYRLPVKKVLIWAGITVAVLWALYPFAWALITSLKMPLDSFQPTFLPFIQFQPTLDNWVAEFGSGGRETRQALGNSALVALGATALATALGTVTGYGLARFRFRVGNKNLISWVLSQRFLPPVATLIPIFLMMRQVGLIDTIFGLIIINTTFVLPFAILITRDFFADFPEDLEEAALVDGATRLQILLRVALPIAAPAIAAAAVICFAFSWNEYLFASIMAPNRAQTYPLLVGSSNTGRGIAFHYLATRMLIAVALPVVLSLFVQRFIVRGLTMGAVKG